MCKVDTRVSSDAHAAATTHPAKAIQQATETDDAADLTSVIPVIGVALSTVAERNQQLSAQNKESLKPFQSDQVPPISIIDYMNRIVKYAFCSPECYIFALIYIDRLISNTGGRITLHNVHRLLITSIMLAAKGRDDKYYSNAYYSTLGGVTNTELNKLEVAFLSLINFDLYVSNEVFTRYRAELIHSIPHLMEKKGQ